MDDGDAMRNVMDVIAVSGVQQKPVRCHGMFAIKAVCRLREDQCALADRAHSVSSLLHKDRRGWQAGATAPVPCGQMAVMWDSTSVV